MVYSLKTERLTDMLYVALFILAILSTLASFFMALRAEINEESEYVVSFFTTTTLLSIVAAMMFFHDIFWRVG